MCKHASCERVQKRSWKTGAEVRIIKNNRVGMKDAYENAGANARFRRHHLLSPASIKGLGQ